MNTPLSRAVLSILVLLTTSIVTAEEALDLIDAKAKQGGWQFDNGREFPGAQGSLAINQAGFRDQPTLTLSGDFSEGGNYVQAATTLPNRPIETISFWIKAPEGASTLPMRLIDGTKQCHQLRVKIADHGRWQHIVLPVQEYFARMGTAKALDLVSQYQQWGGANDSRWHQPGRLLVLMFTKATAERGDFEFAEVRLHSLPKTTEVEHTVTLDESLQANQLAWTLNLGREFKGAQGDLTIRPDDNSPAGRALRLRGDFTAGGAYVGMNRPFPELAGSTIRKVRFRLRSNSASKYSLRLIDGTGQVHQRRNLALKPDGKWHTVEIVPQDFAGTEHWGGADDGRWHGALSLIDFMVNTGSAESKQPELWLSSLSADVVLDALPGKAAFQEDFDQEETWDNTRWKLAGEVSRTTPGAQDSSGALRLQRTVDTLRVKTSATGPWFRVQPGQWEASFAQKSQLHSPDNSYHARTALEFRDPQGAALPSASLGIAHGTHPWQTARHPVRVPTTAATARLVVSLEKTYGTFFIDSITARRLHIQPLEPTVERIEIDSTARGNLFLPDAQNDFHVKVKAAKPLAAEQQFLSFRIVDYWGAEQAPAGRVALRQTKKDNATNEYTASIRVPASVLEVGKFYELHVSVTPPLGEPATEFSGFAILPPAVTRDDDPLDVPFTIRNWDSRIRDYFYLADRLGIRLMGIWGGWSHEAPYKPHAPGIDLCKELGAKWVTGTPASSVERNGFDKHSPESLAAGMTNFLKVYADNGLAMIALGNEPHGSGQTVLDNVAAYRAVYEAVKKHDPTIHVIGTSVEPNREYFEAGYHNYLDSYDFHIYESYENVRKTMQAYRKLMADFNAVKPIHSTELGLNSQGQARRDAARELIKKCTVFFAEGGATVSWFTIMYPDPQGKARGQFGNAHCVFDCQYNHYNPRLDAVTYYHLVNAIEVKKFVDEQTYPGGVQAFLFRDEQDHALQILWCDEARRDVQVDIPSGTQVTLTQIDGTQHRLRSTSEGVSITVSADPVLLQYDSSATKLATQLGKPLAKLQSPPEPIAPGQSTSLVISGKGLSANEVQVTAPLRWTSHVAQDGADRVRLTLGSPLGTSARQGRLQLRCGSGAMPGGLLTVEVPVDSEP